MRKYQESHRYLLLDIPCPDIMEGLLALFGQERSEDRTEFERIPVEPGWVEMMNIKTLEGRLFSDQIATDTAAMVFNEAAIGFMGLEDPVGQTVELWGDPMTIIGVVKDFHFQSFHEEVKPLFFWLYPDRTYNIMIKINGGMTHEVVKEVEAVYDEFVPAFPIRYSFLEDDYNRIYVSERQVSTLARYFAGLSIIISCLGLFGLAAFTAERRTKEIGIRKILGAGEFGIISMLTSDFTKMIAVSIIIAIPISFYLTSNWLKSFVFRIDVEWWFFAQAGLLAILIAWITVGYQTMKAARMNPAKSLKEE